jgi:hypothetical protein
MGVLRTDRSLFFAEPDTTGVDDFETTGMINVAL